MHTTILPKLLIINDWTSSAHLNQVQLSHRLPLVYGGLKRSWASQASSLWQLNRVTMTLWLLAAQSKLNEAEPWLRPPSVMSLLERGTVWWRSRSFEGKIKRHWGESEESKPTGGEAIRVQGTANLGEMGRASGWCPGENEEHLPGSSWSCCWLSGLQRFCSWQCFTLFWYWIGQFSAAPIPSVYPSNASLFIFFKEVLFYFPLVVWRRGRRKTKPLQEQTKMKSSLYINCSHQPQHKLAKLKSLN